MFSNIRKAVVRLNAPLNSPIFPDGTRNYDFNVAYCSCPPDMSFDSLHQIRSVGV